MNGRLKQNGVRMVSTPGYTDIDSDSAFCHLCMTAAYEGKLLASTRRDQAFLSKGFTYWKEATTAFKKHQASQCHKEANEAINLLPQQVHDIGELLSQKHSDQKVQNRGVFIRILQNLRFLARQGLALRGSHGEEAQSNFMQLFHLRGKDCPLIESWVSKKTNNYLSHHIQNECLQIMALQILRQVTKNISGSACFTIMADECSDVANKEQFTICIRWVDQDLQDHEDFIGLYEVESISADCLTQAIKDTLLRVGLKISGCRGQCYDGASNMSGIKNGVATQIAKEEKRAVYTHCYAHALNLAVGNTIKRSKVCSDALDVAFEISKLVKFSPKRNAAFDRIKAEVVEEDGFAPGIRTFCPTRWTVRGNSIGSILENYKVLKQLWEECLETRLEPDVRGRIIGVSTQMSKYDLLFGLKLCERILKITDNLSMTLQTESLSAAEAQSIAADTIDTLKGIRSVEKFELFFHLIESLCTRLDCEEPVLPRKRKAPRHLEYGDGEGYHSLTIEEHYRQQYFEALDLAISSIQDRFNQPGYATYKNLESLLLKVVNQGDYSAELQEVVSFYGDDVNEVELTTQLQILSAKFAKDFQPDSPYTLKMVLSFLRDLSAGQRIFYKQVCNVARLVIVMPSTNAASERSFSVMRRIKNYLRSTMTQARLNHLMILNVYKELLDELDLKVTANLFVQGSEHRLTIFGTF